MIRKMTPIVTCVPWNPVIMKNAEPNCAAPHGLPQGRTPSRMSLVHSKACMLGGTAFGAWTSTLIGLSTPNTALARFEPDIEAGKILLMVDVPVARVEEIEELIARRHPEAVDKGVDPSMPAFP